METKDYLRILREEIHSTVIATVDEKGRPVTRVIDMMLADEHSLYFITVRCRGCRICYSKCPQKCIDLSVKPLVIRQEHCLHCGNCMAACPFGAVEKR